MWLAILFIIAGGSSSAYIPFSSLSPQSPFPFLSTPLPPFIPALRLFQPDDSLTAFKSSNMRAFKRHTVVLQADIKRLRVVGAEYGLRSSLYEFIFALFRGSGILHIFLLKPSLSSCQTISNSTISLLVNGLAKGYSTVRQQTPRNLGCGQALFRSERTRVIRALFTILTQTRVTLVTAVLPRALLFSDVVGL